MPRPHRSPANTFFLLLLLTLLFYCYRTLWSHFAHTWSQRKQRRYFSISISIVPTPATSHRSGLRTWSTASQWRRSERRPSSHSIYTADWLPRSLTIKHLCLPDLAESCILNRTKFFLNDYFLSSLHSEIRETPVEIILPCIFTLKLIAFF